APAVFANNRLSAKLVSNDPTSDIVSLLYVDFSWTTTFPLTSGRTGESLLASAHLGETLATTYEGPEIPFERATGHAFFDYYKTEKGKKQGARFPRAMIGWGDITGKGFLQKVYPWTSLLPDTTVCDIGGGNGHVTMGLMRAHPHLKVVLQDQPQVIEQAKLFWKEHHPEALKAQRVEYVPFDFFKDTAAEGCDVRDWPDEESLRILENVRKAMTPNSRLIIHDTVLRPSTSGSAPSPLLPNWGAAKARTYEMDLIMMNLLGAKARTLDEFKALCQKANLKFEQIYEAGETDLVKFVPV
ncbi:hypothetical protein MPER_07103, partial [Moniliophthora perniciosa FA553]